MEEDRGIQILMPFDKHNAARDFELEHRKRWLPKPIYSKRYIRGILSNVVKEKIHSRKTGQTTTDPIIRARVLKKTGGICYLCKRQWNPKLARLLPHLYFSNLQIDHIVPFGKMGPNSVSNYLPICSRCNNKKSDLSLAEYHAGVKKKRFG